MTCVIEHLVSGDGWKFPSISGADPGFFKGGSQGNGYMYKLYYIHIAIIHIIILNEVHCNLLKAIDA